MIPITTMDIRLLMVSENSLSTFLEHKGYKSVGIQPYLASGFLEVKKMLAKHPIDVILIDWENNRLDPFEIVNYIRSTANHKETPIIVSSVHSCDDRIVKSKGIDLFIKQPVPRILLLERIRTLLNKKNRNQTRHSSQELYLDKVNVKAGEHTFSTALADLSQSGLFVYSETNLTHGEGVLLSFKIPGSGKPIEMEGTVVRVTRRHKINDKMNKGIAIQFTQFLGNSEERLGSFLKEKKPDSNFMYYYL